jgi:anti-sigma B factor antagonist
MPLTARPHFEVFADDDRGTPTLELRGELDMATAPILRRAIAEVAEREPQRIVLDLRELQFMDVAGVRTIIEAARRMRREGGALVLTNPLPHILRLLELILVDRSVVVEGRPLSSVS